MAKWRTITSLTALALALGSACCPAAELAQELKLQYSNAHTDSDSVLAAAAAQHYSLWQGNYRLKLHQQRNAWSFDFAYVLSADVSSALPVLDELRPGSSGNYFDWRSDSRYSSDTEIAQFVDRASLTYSGAHWVVKLGRQAITWGNGNVFQVLDLFNPFAPTASDTSYKPGVDMLYVQRLFDSGADVQLLWLPRRQLTAEQNNDRDSLALKYQGYWQDLQFELMLAQDYGDRLMGIGLVAPLGTAIVKLDMLASEYQAEPFVEQRMVYSAVLNLQYSWQWLDKPLSGFVEYYRNGYGADIQELTQLASGARARVQRGQLYSLGKDQFAAGLQIQWSPLLLLTPSLVYQLNDHSLLGLLSLSYNSSQASNLIFGLQLAFGRHGSQYGGYFVDDTHLQIAQQPEQWYLRYEYYF